MFIKPKTLKIFASHPVQYQVPLWRQLVAEGWQIEVAYYHGGTAIRSALDADFGIEFQWDLDLVNGYPHIFLNQGTVTFGLGEQIACFGKMIAWMIRDRNTPILVMGWFAESIWLLWLIAVILQQPHLVISETTLGSFNAMPKPRWRVSLLGWLLRHTTANLFIGIRNHAFLREMGALEERLFHIPYSIDNARFSAEAKRLLPERIKLCRQYGLNPDKPVFLFCGKLIAKKRPLQLLEAYLYAGLADEAQLVYVGEGELRPELEQRIRALGLKHVHLLGFLNQTQMPQAYVLGGLLCLISDSTETWGLVVNEAFACGRPVIVSETIGCAPDLVGPDTGWIVPLDDLPSLAHTMRSAYVQRYSWPEMGRLAQEKISRHTFIQMVAGVQSALKIL